jgi:hypothetical protein
VGVTRKSEAKLTKREEDEPGKKQKSAFQRALRCTARSKDESGGIDFCVNQITLTPRYRVTHYRMRLQTAGCDSFLECASEFDIRLLVENELINTWKWQALHGLDWREGEGGSA